MPLGTWNLRNQMDKKDTESEDNDFEKIAFFDESAI